MTVPKLLALVLVTGCGTTVSATMLNESPKPLFARPPASVEMFVSAPPSRPYVDVALLEAEQQSDMSIDGTDAFIHKLRDHAATLGCDGVVLGHETNRPTVATADVVHDVAQVLSKKPIAEPIDYGAPANLRGMTATCIVYVPEQGELEDLEARRAAATQVASTAYDTCKQQRIQLLQRVQQEPKATERGKLLRAMPTCFKPQI
jgi:hypothetical protein